MIGMNVDGDNRSGGRWLGALAAVLLIAPFAAFAIYDLLYFQTRSAEIETLLMGAQPQESQPPAALLELQRLELGDNLTARATQVVLWRLDRGEESRSALNHHLRQWLWMRLVDLHLTDEQQRLLDLSRTYLGQRDYGYQSGAMSIFGKPLDALSDRELATLVVIARWPTRYREPAQAEAVARRAEALLVRLTSRS